MTKYIYATASIKLPISFIVKSLSKDASHVQTNWMGYIAVATDQGKAMLGRRDIVVAWRGTLQPYEWANDFDFPLEPAISVFPVTDPKNNPHIGSGWLDVYTASDSRSPYDTTSAREQVFTFFFIKNFETSGLTRTVPNLNPPRARKKTIGLIIFEVLYAGPYFHISFLLMALYLGFGFRYNQSSRGCWKFTRMKK